MIKLYSLFLLMLCLSFGSCCGGPIYVSFINETSTPVKVTYSTKNMNYDHSIYYDTISYEIGADSIYQLYLKATYNNGKKRLSKCIPFFKFETPTRSVRFDGPDEVIKIFDKNGEFNDTYKFIISDSLFNCK